MFFQTLYFEHARGEVEYQHSLATMADIYFADSRSQMRVLASEQRPDYGAMDNDTTYAKGALVAHMLRRKLGDQKFFGGLNRYLTKFQFQPVVTRDLMARFPKAPATFSRRCFSNGSSRPVILSWSMPGVGMTPRTKLRSW
jgi:aminopeptidase N